MTPETNDLSPARFGREYRVRKQAEFDRVYGGNAYAADRVLVLNGCWNDLPRTRLGLSISRRVGNAVVRNRWKRLIRETFRRVRGRLPVGLDLVVRPRRGAEPHYQAIQRSLPELVRRLVHRLQRESRL